jgi:hypothetical protein
MDILMKLDKSLDSKKEAFKQGTVAFVVSASAL